MACCGFCHRGKDAENVCGKLYSSLDPKCTAHKKCMQYSALLVQYKFGAFGGFKIRKVVEELKRAHKLKCHECKRKKESAGIRSRGASSGCAWNRCNRSYHFYCASQSHKVITRRIEVINRDTGDKLVKYRVFCSEEHQKKCEAQEYADIAYVSESDENSHNDCDESGSDTSQDSDASTCDYGFQDSVSEVQTTAKAGGGMKRRAKSQWESEAAVKRMKVDSSSFSEEADSDSSSKDGVKKVLPDIGRFRLNGSGNSPVSDKVQGSHKRTPCKARSNPPAKDHHTPAKDQLMQVKRGFANRKTVPANRGADGSAGTSETFQPKLAAPPTKKKEMQSGSAVVEQELFRRPARKVQGSGDNADYVLVFLVSGQLSKDTKRELKWLGEKVTGVAANRVFIWPHVAKLNSKLMMYYLRQLSNLLREGDSPEVERLIFQVNNDDLRSYQNHVAFNKEMGQELETKIYAKLPGTIMRNLAAAEKRYGESVGSFCELKGSYADSYILFLIISDTIDLTHTMRARLRTKQNLAEWTPQSRLADSYDLNMNQLEAFHSKEFKRLRLWLSSHLQFMDMHCLPLEDILRSEDDRSVTRKLWQHFESTVESNPRAPTVAFFLPVDCSIVVYQAYVHKCIAALLEEHLTVRRELLCILDVGNKVHMTTYGDVIGKLPKHISVKVHSLPDPEKTPVTCLILQFTFNADAENSDDHTEVRDGVVEQVGGDSLDLKKDRESEVATYSSVKAADEAMGDSVDGPGADVACMGKRSDTAEVGGWLKEFAGSPRRGSSTDIQCGEKGRHGAQVDRYAGGSPRQGRAGAYGKHFRQRQRRDDRDKSPQPSTSTGGITRSGRSSRTRDFARLRSTSAGHVTKSPCRSSKLHYDEYN